MRTFRQFCEYVGGEYVFGYELEALIVATDPELEAYARAGHGSMSHDRAYALVAKIFGDKLGLDGKVVYDASVGIHGGAPDWVSSQARQKIISPYQIMPFEFKSVEEPMTYGNLSKVMRSLDRLKEVGVFTNKSCGFHVHLSWPNMTAEDTFWVVMQFALDPDSQRFFVPVINGKEMKFTSDKYADLSVVHALRAAAAYISAGDGWDRKMEIGTFMNSASHLFSNQKKRVLRIHPQGTMEWRGPRGFLDDGTAGNAVSFVRDVLVPFRRKVDEYLSNDSAKLTVGASITKEEFLEGLRMSPHETDVEFKKQRIKRNLADA